jgi:cysteine desulfurase
VTRRIYLDNNATTRVDPEVVQAMLPYFTERFGNASSKHDLGEDAATAVRAARRQVRELLGATSSDEIVFTSGGSESDNTALLAALETQNGRDEIITSQVEHPAILALCEHLEKAGRASVHRIPVDEAGRLDSRAYRRALSSKVACVSFMWANNETGAMFPIAQLAEMAHEVGALFHTDAVQAAGKVPMQVRETQIDMLSLSAHKFHGPKGIGALYVRNGVKVAPLIRGGRQERGRRAGTENVPAIVGLGKAAELARHRLESEMPRVRDLRDRLEAGLLARIGSALVLGDPGNRLPNTVNIAFEHLESDPILLLLNRRGIAASSGSACASGSMEPSHVLRAMQVPYTYAFGAVRFSLSRENTAEDVDAVIDATAATVAKLRDDACTDAVDGRLLVESYT